MLSNVKKTKNQQRKTNLPEVGRIVLDLHDHLLIIYQSPFLHFNQSTNKRKSKPANKFDPSKNPQETQLEYLSPDLVSITVSLRPLPSTNLVHRSCEHLW